MTSCKNCRALEFISDGIKRGVICDIKFSEPRYNCALSNKIILVNGEPCCEDCKDKTTTRKKMSYEDYQNASNDITFSQYPIYRGK